MTAAKLRDKIFDYETTPPPGVWADIANALDADSILANPISQVQPKTTSFFNFKFLATASAAAAVLFICFMVFRKPHGANVIEYSSNDSTTKTNSGLVDEQGKRVKHHDAILQIPKNEEMENTDTAMVATNIPQSNDGPSETSNTPKSTDEKDVDVSDVKESGKIKTSHRYVTIKSGEGESIKVSSKVAKLFASPDASTTSDPKWNKKIAEWKKAMLSNTIAATPGNFLDIVELTNTVTDN